MKSSVAPPKTVASENVHVINDRGSDNSFSDINKEIKKEEIKIDRQIT